MGLKASELDSEFLNRVIASRLPTRVGPGVGVGVGVGADLNLPNISFRTGPRAEERSPLTVPTSRGQRLQDNAEKVTIIFSDGCSYVTPGFTRRGTKSNSLFNMVYVCIEE